MGNCKDCLYWNRNDIRKAQYAEDDMANMADCLNEKLDNAIDAKIISSYDGPTSEFITSPNFGCIHFKGEVNSPYTIEELSERVIVLEQRIRDLEHHTDYIDY